MKKNDENDDLNDVELKVSRKYQKKKRNKLNRKRNKLFYSLCNGKQILKLIDRKKYKYIDIYKSLKSDLKEAGFIKMVHRSIYDIHMRTKHDLH